MTGAPAVRRSRAVAAKLSVLVSTIVVILLFGEAVARIADRSEERLPDPGNLPVLSDIFDIARKNVRGVYQGVLFRTNSHGVRGPDYEPQPGRDTFRILITGDSVTMGFGVAEEHAYPAVLERLLNQSAAPGRHYEVLNLGLAGIEAGFAMRRLSKLSAFYQPDLVVYGYTLNDIEGPHYRRRPKQDRRGARQQAWRRVLRFQDSPSHLLRWLWPRWIMVLEWDVFHDEAEGPNPQTSEWYENYFENPPAWAYFEDALGVLAFEARERGICGHVLIHTFLTELAGEHGYRVVYDRVSKAARARGLTVTESLSHFEGLDAKELWINDFDVHPNREGHEILARALFEGVQALPEECRGTASERARP